MYTSFTLSLAILASKRKFVKHCQVKQKWKLFTQIQRRETTVIKTEYQLLVNSG